MDSLELAMLFASLLEMLDRGDVALARNTMKGFVIAANEDLEKEAAAAAPPVPEETPHEAA